MESSSNTTTIADYLRVLAARRWIVVGVTAVAIAIAIAYSALRHPVYDATASIQFQTKYISVFTPGVELPPDVTPSQTAAANSRIVTRPEVSAAVKKALSSSRSAGSLAGEVSTTVQPDSNLIDVTASTGDARFSAQLANAFAEQTRIFAAKSDRSEFANQATELKQSLTKNAGELDAATKKAYGSAIARLTILGQVADPVEIVRPATVPTRQAAPRPLRDTALAAILGLIVGVAAAFLTNSLARTAPASKPVESGTAPVADSR